MNEINEATLQNLTKLFEQQLSNDEKYPLGNNNGLTYIRTKVSFQPLDQ